jgi:hypothetical protein
MNYNEKRIVKKVLKNFQQSFQHYILTSRFNTKTWNENRNFIEKTAKLECIYCAPGPVNSCIPIEAKLFVLEMNNDINRIMGIGLVINHPRIQKYDVYETGNYNRYSFVGKYRIDRIEMNEEEERIMKLFDILCFTGNTHMKRGDGLKMFPIKMLYNISFKFDLVNFIVEMFRRKFKSQT